MSELNLRGTRHYVAARVGGLVVGYAGVMFSGDEAHVTNIAVDPAWHRHQIGTRLLANLARAAVAHGARNLTLEVRMSNGPAQTMYRQIRIRGRRGPQELLRREQRGRPHHVGPRGRHARLRRTPGDALNAGVRGADGRRDRLAVPRAPIVTVILAIETSCDETAAAVVEDGRLVRSSVVSSQVATHAALRRGCSRGGRAGPTSTS